MDLGLATVAKLRIEAERSGGTGRFTSTIDGSLDSHLAKAPNVSESPDDTNALLCRALRSDQVALAALFARHRPRLKRMVKLRTDRRLAGQLDASDVLRKAYLDLAARLADYAAEPSIPFFLWLRLITGQRLREVHQEHLGGALDANLEVSLRQGPLPQVSTMYLASHLLGHYTSAVSQQAARAEIQLTLQETLNSMAEADREILALRHFEELNNEETAQVLNISLAAASGRYVRALGRLSQALSRFPGMFDC